MCPTDFTRPRQFDDRPAAVRNDRSGGTGHEEGSAWGCLLRLNPVSLRSHAVVEHPRQRRGHHGQHQVVEQRARHPLELGPEREKYPGQQTDGSRAQRRRKKAQQLAPAPDRSDLDDRDHQCDDEENRPAEERSNTVQRDEDASPLSLMPPAFSSAAGYRIDPWSGSFGRKSTPPGFWMTAILGRYRGRARNRADPAQQRAAGRMVDSTIDQ
jgi:hypothetical protein